MALLGQKDASHKTPIVLSPFLVVTDILVLHGRFFHAFLQEACFLTLGKTMWGTGIVFWQFSCIIK